MVAAGLFPHCVNYCMARSISMAFDVLADGESWKISLSGIYDIKEHIFRFF